MSNITENDDFKQRLDDAARKAAGSPGPMSAESSEQPPPTPTRRPMPTRPTNASVRGREYLTPHEMTELIKAAGQVGRHRLRDRTLILVGYRHGLRCAEILNLRWDQVDFDGRLLHVVRVKRGTPSTHPLGSTEIRGLNQLKKAAGPGAGFVFTSERGGQLSSSSIRRIIKKAGNHKGLLMLHPHMLRHSCGFKLANDGIDTRAIQAYLGHRNIQCTVRYTELSPGRFDGMWGD